jgi:hypothetical protein
MEISACQIVGPGLCQMVPTPAQIISKSQKNPLRNGEGKERRDRNDRENGLMKRIAKISWRLARRVARPAGFLACRSRQCLPRQPYGIQVFTACSSARQVAGNPGPGRHAAVRSCVVRRWGRWRDQHAWGRTRFWLGDIKHLARAPPPAWQGRSGDGIWQNAGKRRVRLALARPA